MKKLALTAVLLIVVALSGAFAEHPSGWSLGIGYQFGGLWETSDTIDHGLNLLLKFPNKPIYWGISAGFYDKSSSTFWFRLTGDYYFLDFDLAPKINLGWFLGIGAYFQIAHYGKQFNGIDAGGRLPIGLCWMPLEFLEIFLDFAPSVGLFAHLGDNSKIGLGGGWQGDVGIRFWF